MVLDPTPMYHYRMRKGSIIHADAAKNRFDYFLSCIDRMKMITDSLNGEKDIERENAYINKSAVNAAKIISRSEKNKILRDGAIARISQEAKSYPIPSAKFLGIKLWWRAKILQWNPKFFSGLMRGVHILDLDSKHREAQMYE